jgi:hypothetical protein
MHIPRAAERSDQSQAVIRGGMVDRGLGGVWGASDVT